MTYSGPHFIPIPPTLTDGEKEHVRIYHDECATHSNEYPRNFWLKDSEQVLKKKGQGRLIMVSDFITPATPTCRLELSKEQVESNMQRPKQEQVPEKARWLIYPGTKEGDDDYWNMEQMIEQVWWLLCIH